MANLINEAKRFQKLAGIISESQLNEMYKYKNNMPSNVKGHGKISFSRELKDDEIEKFAKEMGYNDPTKIYIDRDGRESTIDGQYYASTDIVDPYPPNAGGKTDDEMKQIATKLGLMKESVDIESVVNEVLAKVRKK